MDKAGKMKLRTLIDAILLRFHLPHARPRARSSRLSLAVQTMCALPADTGVTAGGGTEVRVAQLTDKMTCSSAAEQHERVPESTE